MWDDAFVQLLKRRHRCRVAWYDESHVNTNPDRMGPMNLTQIQQEQKEWSERNFDNKKP